MSKLLLALFMLMLSMGVAAENILRLGIFPYYTPAKLLAIHSPLVDYLNHALLVTVHFSSAPDFPQFRERTASGQYYDVIITAPHLGALAEQEAGYQRVLMTNNRSHAVFIVLQQSELHTLLDLCGKRLLMPPRQAIISQLAINTLQSKDLASNVEIENTTSHNDALFKVLHGQSDAAVIGLPTWNSVTPEQQAQLRVLGVSESIPGFFMMAHSRLSASQVKALQDALLAFEQTPAGRDYLQNSALQGFTFIDDETVDDLEPYVQAFRQ